MLGGYTVRGKGNGEGEGKEVARLLHRGCKESGVCKEPARRLQGSCNDVASRLQGGCKHVARMLQCRKLIQRKALTHSSSDKGCCKDAARMLQ